MVSLKTQKKKTFICKAYGFYVCIVKRIASGSMEDSVLCYYHKPVKRASILLRPREIQTFSNALQYDSNDVNYQPKKGHSIFSRNTPKVLLDVECFKMLTNIQKNIRLISVSVIHDDLSSKSGKAVVSKVKQF